MSDTLNQIWQNATTPTATPGATTAVICALIALTAITWPPLWAITRNAITIAHEAGHGFAALLTGRRLTGIRLHSDTSGLTVSVGKPRGPGMILTAAAGYPAPTILGIGAAALLVRGYSAATLWLCVLILALMLIQIRNWYGLWTILVSAALLIGVTWWGSPTITGAAATTLTAFLLLAPPRTVIELQRQRRRTRTRTTDADQLAQLTHTPAILWVTIFLILTTAGALLGAWWLIDAVLTA